jgi:hypothetical protein
MYDEETSYAGREKPLPMAYIERVLLTVDCATELP